MPSCPSFLEMKARYSRSFTKMSEMGGRKQCEELLQKRDIFALNRKIRFHSTAISIIITLYKRKEALENETTI